MRGPDRMALDESIPNLSFCKEISKDTLELNSAIDQMGLTTSADCFVFTQKLLSNVDNTVSLNTRTGRQAEVSRRRVLFILADHSGIQIETNSQETLDPKHTSQ